MSLRFGLSGSGKTHLATALGVEACRYSYRTRLGMGKSMEAKMRIEPQLPPEHYLPVIQSLPP